MKFGHIFKERLKSEGFPPEWVESAISYSQLKKCINRLTNELSELGLDPQTLRQLLKKVEDFNAANKDDDKPLEYLLAGQAGLGEQQGGTAPFHPMLLVYVNETTGELDSAHLNEETRHKLQLLAIDTGLSDLRVVELPDEEPDCLPSRTVNNSAGGLRRRPGYRTVEVPLTSDIEFFSTLAAELVGLEELQEREQRRMRGEIERLGKQIARQTDPDRRANKKLLAIWRQIFQIYVESDIFFGTTESDHSARDSEAAVERFEKFASTIASHHLVDQMKREENLRALTAFMDINRNLLQGLRFGEINRIAMTKILKKFDKQTALGVKKTFPQRIEYPDFSQHLARAVCAEVNTQILSHVPRIDDYTCAMCMDIQWRPVRLRCQHVFCIRCLIVMQTNKQHFCPLCREKTVFDANAENLDLEMASFLKKWFPDEVKLKQRHNQLMAGKDEYGEVYQQKCCVM
ncbi:RING-14 protein-like protein [Sporormia fimetaria CBS 119925]|uniref:RING-14 protein-like protein n=1 Tax=Sporormia fimetaria CBS 119925 TaxID=1340428 RepID=A0A6A6VRC0_9PLEO|nr:RING-14 protein-like protein [Sporormia fimetaria CBS 119925]